MTKLTEKEKAQKAKAQAELKAKRAVKKAAPKKPAKAEGKPAKAEPSKAIAVQPTKAEAKAAKVKAQTEFEKKTLAPIAKEVNVRLEKADRAEKDADDHRLAAALRLADAEKVCAEAGIKFKAWASEHITKSFETVRKLVYVGRSDNPQQALEDMRGRNAEANRELRERQKADREALQIEDKTPSKVSPKDPEKLFEDFCALRTGDKMAFVSRVANEVGLKVIDPLKQAR